MSSIHQAGRESRSDPEPLPIRAGEEVLALHPYLGYVVDPERHAYVSDYGFTGNDDPLRPKAGNDLVVAFFGGSFAGGVFAATYDTGGSFLEETGKNVVLLHFPVAGYKQPQQLMALAFLLGMGAQFDVVVNIDGFNEVALPPVENVPKGVFPIYPRAWYYLSQHLPDPVELGQLGQLALLGKERRDWALFFERNGLYRSAFLSLFWERKDGALAGDESRIATELQGSGKDARGYSVHGPRFVDRGDDALYDFLAFVWHESSFQMAALCEAKGIRYFHFLQPNQYVAGSKPMGEKEKRRAIQANHPYRQGAVKGYPYLRRYGRELLRRGVRFVDMTQIFAETETPLYSDACCHLTPEGYRLVLDEIEKTLLEELGIGPK